jgi:hypothetical protein
MEDSKAVANIGPNPFEAYGNATVNTRIVGQLLKFSKGDYLAGQDNTDIPLGTKLAAIMDQLMVGWIKWQDNKPVEHDMGLVASGHVPKKRAELDDNDADLWETDDEGEKRDPWQYSNYLIVVDQKEKTPFTFTTSSKGGINAIGELCKIYGKVMRERPDEYPIIELGVGSYLHPNKKYGRIKYPVFINTKTRPPSVFGWAAKAPLLKLLEGAATSEPEESDVVKAEREEQAAKASRRGVKLKDTF